MIIFFLFLIVYPFYKLEIFKEEKREIENDILNQKNILKMQREKIENLKNRKNSLKKERDLIEKEEKNKIFDYSSDAYDFLQEKLEKNSLQIELIGRELLSKLDEKKSKVSLYMEIKGKEEYIFNFLEELEKTEKYIWLEKNNFFIEKIERNLKLNGDYMYIIKNKKIEKINFKRKNKEVFKEKVKRKVGGSVRKI